MFSGHTVLPDSKETKLAITGIVLVPYRTAIFGSVDISEAP